MPTKIKLTREERLDYMVYLTGCYVKAGASGEERCADMALENIISRVEKAMAKEEEAPANG
jgi:hypothetical protein